MSRSSPVSTTVSDALEQARAYIEHDVETQAPGWRTAQAIVELIDTALSDTSTLRPDTGDVRKAAIMECIRRIDDLRCIPINSTHDRTEALKDAQVSLRALSVTSPDRPDTRPDRNTGEA